MTFKLKFNRTPPKLTGQALLDYMEQARLNDPDMSKAELALGAGYRNEHNRASFTEFYEALLDAKGHFTAP